MRNIAIGNETVRKLVARILSSAVKDFLINRVGIIHSVQKMLQEHNIKIEYIKGASPRETKFISKAKAAVSKRSMLQWFREIKIF